MPDFLKCRFCGSSKVEEYFKRSGSTKYDRTVRLRCKSCRKKFLIIPTLIKESKEKKSYPQKWSLYNQYQTNEKTLFLKILSNAVDSLEIPYQWKKNGRPPYPLDDMLKVVCIKVFNNFSVRRTIFDIRVAYALGYIRFIPHFNSISNYMADERLMPYLHALYKILAEPLKNVENNFSVDSTGFSLLMKNRWIDAIFDRKNGKEIRNFDKLHIIAGNKTNIVVAANTTKSYSNDSPHFIDLVQQASFNFKIREVCADKAYLSRKNIEAVIAVGGLAFIPPKKDSRTAARGSAGWHQMMMFWKDRQDEFLQHYHQRSNVESVFSMMKRKFLPYLRSKRQTARFNEMLCKVVCHNTSCLISSIFEMDLETKFI